MSDMPARPVGSPSSAPGTAPVEDVNVAVLGVGDDFTRWDGFVQAALATDAETRRIRGTAELTDASWFHTSAWLRAVHGAFGHTPLYLQAERQGHVVGVLPLFLVRSRLGGRMLVSVPYGIYGGLLTTGPVAAAALRQALLAQVPATRAATVDVRSAHARLEGFTANPRYVTFRRRLPENAEDVLGWLPRKARAASRHARHKHGLKVVFGHENLPMVWRLYSAAMRRLASINYPYRFFESLVEASPDGTLTSLVFHGRRAVGGLLSLVAADTVMPYFVGVDDRFRFANVSNFLYLTLMERAAEQGLSVFDFGRSRRDNAGSCALKRHHGFEPGPLGYQEHTAPGKRRVDLTPTGRGFGWARRLWPHLPLALTRRLGARLARHIPG